MNKSILVPIADGTEEMEVVTIVDILRRAGSYVTLAGLSTKAVCSRGVEIIPDILIDDISDEEEFDMIVLPGGMKGVKNLSESGKLKAILKYNKSKAIIAAICAAPLILKAFGLLDSDSRITSHPSVKDEFTANNYQDNNVVISGKIVTSRGAGTAAVFSLALVELLYDKSISDRIAHDIVFQDINI